jgi:hypothetical protein
VNTGRITCSHFPSCPSPDSIDRYAAHVLTTHPEQGWSLLCNGVVLFEDWGALLPDGRAVPPAATPVPYPRPPLVSHEQELYRAVG